VTFAEWAMVTEEVKIGRSGKDEPVQGDPETAAGEAGRRLPTEAVTMAVPRGSARFFVVHLLFILPNRLEKARQTRGTRPVRSMSDGLNEGVVGDTAKLMVHRLIVRMLRRDPSLVERAKVAHARQADRFAGWPFVREWQDLLALPPRELAAMLISRDREMVRLRNTSPFYLAEGVDLGDYDAKVRLRRAARRVVKRGLTAQSEAICPRGP
jgi:hypothetical protein